MIESIWCWDDQFKPKQLELVNTWNYHNDEPVEMIKNNAKTLINAWYICQFDLMDPGIQRICALLFFFGEDPWVIEVTQYSRTIRINGLLNLQVLNLQARDSLVDYFFGSVWVRKVYDFLEELS